MGRHTVFLDWKTHIIKTSMLSKWFYRYHAYPIKIPEEVPVEIDKRILKYTGQEIRTRMAITILKKRN